MDEPQVVRVPEGRQRPRWIVLEKSHHDERVGSTDMPELLANLQRAKERVAYAEQ